MLKRFFSPPVFAEDEEKSRAAKLLHQIVMASWSLPLLAIVVIFLNPTTSRFVIPAGAILAVTLVVLTILNRAGMVNLASAIMVGMLVTIFTYLNYNSAGEPRPLILLTVIAIMMSGLLLGSRGPIIVAILLTIQHGIIVSLQANGIITSQGTPPTPPQNIIVTSVSYLLIGFLLRLAISRIQFVVNQIRESERSLQASNLELQDLSASLEQRVADRTNELAGRSKELEIANISMQRRAAQFEALAQVTQSITSIRDLRELLPHIAEVISAQFGFYHVGVFLLDEVNEYAVLSATNSEGGKKMIERKHRLLVGEQGIVGVVTATGDPRIAMDVGVDAVFFNNPELPDTHSEMALALKSGGRIVGALDVQSTATAAFTEEDIQMLSLLASQVSLAIENARLFDEARRALAESEAVSRQSTREAWGRLPAEQNLLGYRYNLTGAAPLEKLVELTRPGEGSTNGKQMEASQVIVPIVLRGETIGTLVVQSPSAGRLNQDQVDLIKAVAERVALSAENARLFEETARRAERERLVSDITGKIRSANDPQSMIQTAMDELRKALGASRVEVIPQVIQSAEKTPE